MGRGVWVMCTRNVNACKLPERWGACLVGQPTPQASHNFMIQGSRTGGRWTVLGSPGVGRRAAARGASCIPQFLILDG